MLFAYGINYAPHFFTIYSKKTYEINAEGIAGHILRQKYYCFGMLEDFELLPQSLSEKEPQLRKRNRICNIENRNIITRV